MSQMQPQFYTEKNSSQHVFIALKFVDNWTAQLIKSKSVSSFFTDKKILLWNIIFVSFRVFVFFFFFFFSSQVICILLFTFGRPRCVFLIFLFLFIFFYVRNLRNGMRTWENTRENLVRSMIICVGFKIYDVGNEAFLRSLYGRCVIVFYVISN